MERRSGEERRRIARVDMDRREGEDRRQNRKGIHFNDRRGKREATSFRF